MKLTERMLKSGFEYLIDENEDQFKKSLIDVLSFKLNESINYINFEVRKKLLSTPPKFTPNDENIKHFVNFLEQYDPKNPSKIKLKNESVINITENELIAIKNLFDQLGPKNRLKMVEEVFESKKNLDEHVEFYNKTKALNK